MSKAWKCDLTGEIMEGEEKRYGEVAVSPTVRLVLQVQVRKDAKAQFQDGHICSAVEKQIQDALAPVLAKIAGKPNGGK